MSEKLTPQYAQVEQPFGCEPPLVHCPICGKATLEMSDEEGGEITPCLHLAFIYVGEVGEFVYKSQDFQQKTEGFDDEELEFDTFGEFLQKAEYDNKLLAIEITYGGMGSGPNWFTNVFGFDYGSLARGECSD